MNIKGSAAKGFACGMGRDELKSLTILLKLLKTFLEDINNYHLSLKSVAFA